MRVLVDQDVYELTVRWLRENGHDVVTASEIGFHQANDEDLLRKASEMKRLLVTRDKGFGALAFLKAAKSSGVILLRISPEALEEVHQELGRLFQEHTEKELCDLFCVVEPHRHRVRRLFFMKSD